MALTPRRTRFLLIYGSVLLAGVLVFVALGGLQGRAPAPSAKGSPKPEPKKRAPRPTKFGISGRVREQGGLPLAGATVYVLPKKRLGSDRDGVPHEVTDDAGRWDLRVRALKEAWVGVVAPGYRTIWLDGDAQDPEQPIEMELTRAPALDVTVRYADGTPVVDKGVQLEAWPPGGVHWCPGPQCRRIEQWGVTDADGKVTFRVATPGPVTATAYVERHHSVPTKHWIPDAQGPLDIVVKPNVSLQIDFRSATPIRAADDLVTAEFYTRGGARAFAVTEAMQAPGVLRIEQALQPGLYDLRITMPGWEDVLLPDLLLPAGDVPRRVAVTMTAAAPRATLALRLEGNRAERRRGTRVRAPLVWARRVTEPLKRLGWQLAAPEAWSAARSQLDLELPPGSWQLLVADVLTGRAAMTPTLALEAGTHLDLPLPMQPGQVADVPAVRSGALWVRDLGARTPSGEALPVFGSNRDGTLRFRGAVDLIARKLVGQDVVLGPYPMDAFTMLVVRSDQTIQEVDVR